MGCDIHMFAEVKAEGKWKETGRIFKNPYHRPEEPNKIDDDGYQWNPEFSHEPYEGRCYDLFSILADVRNGYGFAGVKTGEGFNPIAEPRGIPEDVSDFVKKKSDSWDSEGHSHSYFTVKELLDFDWGQITMKRGFITLEQYKEIREKGGSPDHWCGGISGPKVHIVEEREADHILYVGKSSVLQEFDIYVNYRWSDSYAARAGSFLTETLPILQKLGDPEEVRIVFWFDN